MSYAEDAPHGEVRNTKRCSSRQTPHTGAGSGEHVETEAVSMKLQCREGAEAGGAQPRFHWANSGTNN